MTSLHNNESVLPWIGLAIRIFLNHPESNQLQMGI